MIPTRLFNSRGSPTSIFIVRRQQTEFEIDTCVSIAFGELNFIDFCWQDNGFNGPLLRMNFDASVVKTDIIERV